MKKAVRAEFCHLSSTNEISRHHLCPVAEDSWCKYQKAIANDEIYDHPQHSHYRTSVMDKIKPIFGDLSNTELLKKCLHGGTQNPSESVDSVVWSHIPKSNFVLKSYLECGVYEAISTFNNGNIVKCRLLKGLGIDPGSNCVNTMKNLDETRINEAEKAVDEIKKKVSSAKQLS